MGATERKNDAFDDRSHLVAGIRRVGAVDGFHQFRFQCGAVFLGVEIFSRCEPHTLRTIRQDNDVAPIGFDDELAELALSFLHTERLHDGRLAAGVERDNPHCSAPYKGSSNLSRAIGMRFIIPHPSFRNATAGSTRPARRAGSALASSDTASTNKPTLPSIHGSCGEISNN